MHLQGKRALVMGLGVHGGGVGVARFLALQGAEVTVTDLRTADDLRASIEALAGLPIRFVLGEHREADFRQAEIVVRNPAAPPTSQYLQIARAAGAVVEMEMTLFFRFCPGPILGVTGTKGKTTTTLLLGAMLREQFPDTVIAGNLRISALDQLPLIGIATPVVLELSSFVLEGLGEAGLSPKIACMTTIAPDHLDRHGTMEAYIQAKEQIWRHQHPGDAVVLNADAPVMRTMAVVEQRPGDVVWFAGPDGAHRLEGKRAAFWRGNELIWQDCANDGSATHAVICTRDDVRLPGGHNLANIAAATAAACAFGVAPERIRRAVQTFSGVEHRLEFVREHNGVRYINDTAATAPEAAIAALRTFDAPIVLIAGGADKNLPFDALAREIAQRARAVILLQGTATPALQDALRITGAGVVAFGPFDDFEQALDTARRIAAPGDIVLLSPGCASFGMFRNEFHRGETFRRIVQSFP
ncbi:UDP-N-acetylmuramoyl-L-alanine--D-glutamate ligase [Roseiflexus sp.]|uniref:UDP-N-acetylmuramoyl-L-alanine--D-glutamate ligase n=1 Tax=Roseiflexus sp. TaxID=2562120 RepID=UPI00398A7610